MLRLRVILVAAVVILAFADAAKIPRFSSHYLKAHQMRDVINGGKIVGGQEVTPNSVPYQLSLQYRNGFHFCGASILNENYALTAAHCCELIIASEIQVVAGEHALSQTSGYEQLVPISKVTYHEDFGTNGMNNDICILKTAKPFQMNE